MADLLCAPNIAERAQALLEMEAMNTKEILQALTQELAGAGRSLLMIRGFAMRLMRKHANLE